MDWKAAYLLADIAILLVATSFERVPAEVAMFTALLALWVPGILDTKTALAGWSNGGLMTVIALFIVVGGVQKLPLISRLAAWAFGDPRKTNPRIALLKQITVVAALSIFINNTPLVALFIPIVLDWCRTYRVSPSRYLLPLSYASIMGDLSVIGTSTSLVAQGLILQRNLPPMSFFDIAYVGAPAAAAGALYLVTLGYNLLPSAPRGAAGGSDAQKASEAAELAAAETDYVVEMLIPKAAAAAPRAGDSLPLSAKLAAPFTRAASLAGQPVAVKLAQIFSGDATALRILRAAGSTGSEAAVIEPVGVDEVFQAGDRVIVRAAPASVAAAFTHAQHHGFAFRAVGGGAAASVPDRDARRYRSLAAWAAEGSAWLQRRVGGGGAQGAAAAAAAEAALASAPLAAATPSAAADSSPAAAPAAAAHSRVPYELLLSSRNAFVGGRVGEGLLEEAYGVTVLGYRPALTNPAAARLTLALRAPPTAAELAAVSVAVAPGEKGGAEAAGLLLQTVAAPALPPAADAGAAPPAAAAAAALVPSDAIFYPGDAVLVTGPKDLLDAPSRRRDFFAASPLPGVASVEGAGWSQFGSLGLLIAMFVVGSIGFIGGVPFEMEKAAMVAAGLNLLLGYVKPKEIYTLIQWDLVVLIGASFGLGAAMDSTGLAKLAAGWVVGLKQGPHGSLFLLYGLTLLLTEIISNNAAVTLTIPIAAAMAKQLGVSPKPFLLATTIASTAAFAVPLGYQTHLMVLGPGGYTNLDFFKVGLIMDLIYWAVIAGLSPVVWPF